MSNRPDAMMDVNYRATIASAEGYFIHYLIKSVMILTHFNIRQACEKLNFSHYIQGSSQAVNAERAGQVPYSRYHHL